MQLTGRTCSLTGQKIQMAALGIGCSTCDAAYLRSAVPESICPQCHQDMNAQAEKELSQRRNETKTILAKGHRDFIFVGAVVLAQCAFNVLGNFVAALAGMGFSSPFSLLAGLVLWVLSRGGNKFARILLIISLIFNVLVEVVTALSEAEKTSDYSASSVLFVLAIANLIALGLLFTRSVNAYLDDQRHPGQD